MSATPSVLESDSHSVQFDYNGDLRRSRLTVFFRGALAIPHIIWLLLWGIPVWMLQLIGWIIAVFMGRLPHGFHNFFAKYTEYGAYVGAYRIFATNKFPPFGPNDAYEINVTIGPLEKQNRLGIFFRFLLDIPAAIVLLFWGIWIAILFIVSFFYCLVMGRIAAGIERQMLKYLRVSTRNTAYMLLLTSDYPLSSGR